MYAGLTNDRTPGRAESPAAGHLPAIGQLLAAALDEVDYGLALADPEARALHLNHRAGQWLAEGGALELRGGRIAAQDAQDAATFMRAVREAAERGLRRMITVGHGDARRSAAVVPVLPGVAALMIGRSNLCEDLSLQCFARAHALSDAETRVLARMGRGQSPAQIAHEHGVALSTVRTQIGAIRAKTGAGSIRDLLRIVAALPPMLGVLRQPPATGGTVRPVAAAA